MRVLPGTTACLLAAAALTGSAPAGAQTPPASDRVLVRLAPGAGAEGAGQVADALDAEGSRPLTAGWRVYRLSEPETLAQVHADLAATDADRLSELDQVVRAAGDPMLGEQWDLANTGQNGGRPGEDITAPGAWRLTADAAPVTVAVIDTGADLGHPDLAGQLWTDPATGLHGWDFVDGDGSLYHGAGDTHGTHVAGIIAATRDNGVGIAGVAANARLMVLRFMDAQEVGRTSDAVAAIAWATSHGARVINASWSSTGYSAALCQAVGAAHAAGVTVVAAAGNSGADVSGTPTWPAACPGVVSVSASDARGELAPFSNFGMPVDLAAPGMDVLSTLPGGGFGWYSGTSMAAPHVTGAAALLAGKGPGLTPDRIRQALRTGAAPLPALAGRVGSGGRLDLVGALNAAGLAPGVDTVRPSAPEPGSPAPDAVVGPAPVFAWAAAVDPGGPVRYRLRVDGTVAAQDVEATTAQVHGLAEGTHTWQVEAYDATGHLAAGRLASFEVDATAPDPATALAPGKPRGCSLTGARPVLSWRPGDDGDSGPVREEVLVDGRLVAAAPATGARLRAPALAPGRHTWSVTTFDRGGNASRSATACLRVPAPGAALRVAVRPGRRTPSRAVTLEVRVPDGARAIQVSNERSFARARWRAPSRRLGWTLAAGPDGVRNVWVRLRGEGPEPVATGRVTVRLARPPAAVSRRRR